MEIFRNELKMVRIVKAVKIRQYQIIIKIQSESFLIVDQVETIFIWTSWISIPGMIETLGTDVAFRN